MLGKALKVFLLAEPLFRTAIMYSCCKVIQSLEMGEKISPKEQERMFDIAGEEAMVVKIRGESLPDAKRERDKVMKASMKPLGVILRDIERADNRVERLKLQLQQSKWEAYYHTQGEDDIPNKNKRWLREEQAKLAQRLAKAEAFNFDQDVYDAYNFVRDLFQDPEDSEDP